MSQANNIKLLQSQIISMRILHIAETITGGPASYLAEVLPSQVKRYGGENISVLIPNEQIEHLPVQGFNVYTFARSGRNIASLITLALSITNTTNKFKPDIIHLHSTFAGVLGRISARLSNFKGGVVYCAHCWSFDRPKVTPITRTYAFIESMIHRNTHAILAISPHELSILKSAGFRMEKVKLIVTGLSNESDVLPKKPAARQTHEPINFLFVGRLDPQKGLQRLLSELQRTPSHLVNLTIVGTPVVSRSKIPLYPNVKYTGWLTREKITNLIETHDAVIMPSLWEGMPILALETMRIGGILVCSNIGPFPFILENGKSGVLLDMTREGFLIDAINALRSLNLDVIRSNARDRFTSRFNSIQMNSQIIDIYEKLAKF